MSSISAGVAHSSVREEFVFQLMMGPGGVGTAITGTEGMRLSGLLLEQRNVKLTGGKSILLRGLGEVSGDGGHPDGKDPPRT